jgi:hypothetical protein
MPGVVVHTCNPRSKELEKGDQEFKTSFNYIV